MTVSRRRILQAGAALPFVSIPGSIAVSIPGRAQRSGILRFGLSAFPPNLQPWINTGASAGTVKLLTHRSLVGYDRTGALRGELAESWSIDAEGAWVFRLRPALFHNGEPVTAEDVKWSIEQIAAEKSTAYMRNQFQSIARVEIPDARTIRLVTRQPQTTLPTWFANYSTFGIWRKSTPNGPVGAGPFRLAAQERGTSLDLVAFDKYYKPGLPKLTGIKLVVYADDALRFAALKSGDVDMIEYVPWQSMGAVEADPRLRLDAVEGPFMDVLFNGTRPPFSDPRVRRAIAHAIRRDEIVKAAFFGRCKPLEGLPILEGTPWYDQELAHGWNYDPARANALLNDAGYPNGFATTLLATSQYGMHRNTAEEVQQHLAAIGIRSELQLPDWSTRVSHGLRDQYDMAIHGVSSDNNDPDGLTVVLDTSLAPTHGRSFKVDAPRTIAPLDKGRVEFDQAN